MNDPNLTMELRLRIAQALLPYFATPERYKGVKARKQELADPVVDDRFTVARAPSIQQWPSVPSTRKQRHTFPWPQDRISG